MTPRPPKTVREAYYINPTSSFHLNPVYLYSTKTARGFVMYCRPYETGDCPPVHDSLQNEMGKHKWRFAIDNEPPFSFSGRVFACASDHLSVRV